MDGAVIDNCPVWCFDEDDNSTRSRSATLENQKTLAFWIATGRDPQQVKQLLFTCYLCLLLLLLPSCPPFNLLPPS